MAESKRFTKKGLTRGKAILIAILAVVLVTVLYVQFGGAGKNPNGKLVGYRPPRAAVATQPSISAGQSVTLASAKLPSNGQTTKDKDTTSTLVIDESRWKSPKLETIVAYDPFALPASFPQPKVAVGKNGKDGEALIAAAAAEEATKLADAVQKLHMEMIELKQQGVHVIVRDGDRYAAVIGDRMLHVGDKINDFTVTAIDPDGGVHIERKESP